MVYRNLHGNFGLSSFYIIADMQYVWLDRQINNTGRDFDHEYIDIAFQIC